MEIIKLRIYLQKHEAYFYVTKYCTFAFGEYIFKLIWILSYRIATQNFHDKLFEGNFDDYKDNLLDYNEWLNYNEFYDNIYINKNNLFIHVFM